MSDATVSPVMGVSPSRTSVPTPVYGVNVTETAVEASGKLGVPIILNGSSRFSAFGYSVCQTSRYIAVGAPWSNSNEGEAYLFVIIGGVPTLLFRSKFRDYSEGSLVGVSVAIAEATNTSNGGHVLVLGGKNDPGVCNAPVNGTSCGTESNAGGALVYESDPTDSSVWVRTAYLKAVDGGASHYFGWSTAALEDWIAIGAPNE
ncbi:MAG: hypothetical protein D6706_18660, partial [Chloroflexi bacterium]